ncbi:MAG TPA: radical SAM family heme chaperone HemW [Steroidobacteraceae bacterium]|nr:radical SAM family heme chaperone HemW [Steroidobacteraceae bacterium]
MRRAPLRVNVPALMRRLAAPPLSLYVHLPWCVRKCPYCDFNSYAVKDTLPESAYVAALERDLEAQAPDVDGREVITIFFGGGTPSLFSPDAIGRVLETARRHLAVAADAEVTLEANPGTIERGRFTGYRSAGVNRVSLGAQSFDARQLEALGRIHSPADTVRAAEELHAAGLTNFNIDLMYALPGQDARGAADDVAQALALAPAHLSHYQLTIEPGTRFAADPPTLPVDDVAAEMLSACHEQLARAGFARYETSAYAAAGKQCRHNLNYWMFGDYLGIGAGAHGKLTDTRSGTLYRTTQQREPRRYVALAPRAIARQAVAPHDLPFEFMMNALRLVGGFELATFTARTGLEWATVAPVFETFQARGLVEIQAGTCKPTPLGVSFVNEMLLDLLPKRAISTGKAMMSMGS